MAIIWVALLLILAGLLLCLLSGHARFSLLVAAVFWLGFFLIVCGLILFLSPFILWLDRELRSILGV